jgi:hypothetical protein
LNDGPDRRWGVRVTGTFFTTCWVARSSTLIWPLVRDEVPECPRFGVRPRRVWCGRRAVGVGDGIGPERLSGALPGQRPPSEELGRRSAS